jgi:hypothetical protein
MAGVRKNPMNRGKQPTAAELSDKGDERATVAPDPNTPTPDPPSPHSNRSDDEDNAGEGPLIREQLRKTPSKERFIAMDKAYQSL